VTKALVPETEAKTEGPGFEAKTKAEAVASETEAKTESVDPKTEAKAARQLIGIGYSIPINTKYDDVYSLKQADNGQATDRVAAK